jgi:hypothetical protein
MAMKTKIALRTSHAFIEKPLEQALKIVKYNLMCTLISKMSQ